MRGTLDIFSPFSTSPIQRHDRARLGYDTVNYRTSGRKSRKYQRTIEKNDHGKRQQKSAPFRVLLNQLITIDLRLCDVRGFWFG
mmetsp:Transcript_53804/g.130861  ORF Transcript_53804/g.130861 Transcript_53804/m.130861 type:complete len:84 (-) Transcript_53804:2307-2558(-)